MSNSEDVIDSHAYDKLRRRYAFLSVLASALIIGTIGTAIGLGIGSSVREHMKESYAIATSMQASSAVNVFLTESDFNEPFSSKRIDEFTAHIDKVTRDTPVEKVKLWALDGTVLYAKEKDVVGKNYRSHLGQLADAAGGKLTYEESDLSEGGHRYESEEHDVLLQTFYPIKINRARPAEVQGVYEVYISLAPLTHHVNSVLRSIAIGLATLIVLIVIIAHFTSRMLRRHNDRLQELSAQLTVQADTDGLTGLFNHRHFHNYLEKELMIATRYERSVGLIMMDLDFFKSVNDRFGHQVGDKVLRNVARVFEDILRDADYAARYGGEEFVVIMPETDSEGAALVAERLREATEALEIDLGKAHTESPRVTVSCGVADFPGCADGSESLIAAADSALLFAKGKGRNRVHSFREISGSVFHEGDLERLVSRLQHASLPTIQALVAAVDNDDEYAHSHGRNLSRLAKKFGSVLEIEESSILALMLAAEVHDVGKVVIPERVLAKPDALSETEIEAIRAHPAASAKIVESAAEMEALLAAVLHHHENWDGSGYPTGMSGADIPFLARVLRIIDSFEAMVSDRPYRKALTMDEAIIELRGCAGKQFDPELVEDFISKVVMGRPAEETAVSHSVADLMDDPAPA